MKLHHVALSFGLLLASLLAACQTPPKPAFRNVPIYPSAQRVDMAQDTEWSRTTSFRTSDSQEAVLAYYKNTLPQQGWVFEGQSYSNLGFFYPDAEKRQPFIIHLRILTSGGEKTNFTIHQLIFEKGLKLSINP